VQVIGALAILLWLVVTGMFLRVNQIPPPDHPAWNGPRDSVQAAMAREVAEAENDRVRKREVYAKLQNRTTLKLLSHRFKIATGWSMVALLVTGVGFIATAVTDDERFATGVLLLTPDGSAAVLDACPTLTAETLKGVQARLDTNKVGVEGAIRVSFEAGACYNTRAHLYIDGKLIRGLVVP
jgi:hypothetical protein